MQTSDAFEPVVEAASMKPLTFTVLDVDVVMVFGPIVTDEH